jgi:hypothetical protein
VSLLKRSISWLSTTDRLFSCPDAVRSNSPSMASSKDSCGAMDPSSSAACQGLTLVHFSAQLEPFLTQNAP